MDSSVPDNNVKNRNFVSYIAKCDCECKNSGLNLFTFNVKTNKEVDERKIDDLDKFLANPPAFFRYKLKAIFILENVFRGSVDEKNGLQQRQLFAKKLSALNIPFVFASNQVINFTSILIAANVELKATESLMIITALDKNKLYTNRFIRKNDGYLWQKSETVTIDPDSDIQDTTDEIKGISNPTKIILTDGHRMDKKCLKHLRAALKSNTVIALEKWNSSNILPKVLREMVKNIYDKNENQYFIIPQSQNVFGISENNENVKMEEATIINMKDIELPFTRTIELEKEVKKFYLTIYNKTTKCFDPLDHEYIIASDKCHRTKVTLTVDTNQLPSIRYDPIIRPEIPELPKKLKQKSIEEIPIIGFFDNSSVICIWNKEKKCYKFSKLWNGKYGKNLTLDFSCPKPKLVDNVDPSFSTYVVYDILKIMSFGAEEIKEPSYGDFKITKDDENPVLLEFDTFEETRKAASPAFLMAFLLKQHKKIIKKEMGEMPTKLGFCIFEECSRPGAGEKVEEGLKEACELLEMGCVVVENQLNKE